jgi:hypothetical protein
MQDGVTALLASGRSSGGHCLTLMTTWKPLVRKQLESLVRPAAPPWCGGGELVTHSRLLPPVVRRSSAPAASATRSRRTAAAPRQPGTLPPSCRPRHEQPVIALMIGTNWHRSTSSTSSPSVGTPCLGHGPHVSPAMSCRVLRSSRRAPKPSLPRHLECAAARHVAANVQHLRRPRAHGLVPS